MIADLIDRARRKASLQKLRKARRLALEYANNVLEERRKNGAQQGQLVYQGVHSGSHHLEYFRNHLKPLAEELPPGFQALEIGSGMGWHAALMKSHGAERVIASEVQWGSDRPSKLSNSFTLHRLAQDEPTLEKAIDFNFDEQRELVGHSFHPDIHFLEAGAEALPARDASLDLQFSVNCLEHIPDLESTFAEAARVLKLGGIAFHSTRPLYYSAFGHHLEDFFPVPWGHLLFEWEHLAKLAAKAAQADRREWATGQPITEEIILKEILPSLNSAQPKRIRDAVRKGPWKVEGWVEVVDFRRETLAHELGIYEALPKLSAEELLVDGLFIRLRRAEKPCGSRLAVRLSWDERRKLRIFKPGRKG